MRRFLTRLENKPVRGLDLIALETDVQLWKEIDCISCANCCKTMSPTYTKSDLKRISFHLEMSVDDFKAKYLYKDRNGDWLNKKRPCQFLDKTTNMCTIYDIRPKDCAGFPHHTKRRMVDYMHVFKQNVEYCPATYRMIEKMMEKVTLRS